MRLRRLSSYCPFLQIFPDASERELAVEKVFAYVQAHRPLPNVGALARLRISRQEIENDPRWHTLRDLLTQQLAIQQVKPRKGEVRVPLLPIAKLKPLLAVRTPRAFLFQFAAWCALYLASFYLVHIVW